MLKTVTRVIKGLLFLNDWAQRMMQLETRETLSYWSKLVETADCPPSGFYSLVSANIKARGIPGVTVAPATMAEGGFLAPNRKYLRIRFKRLSYDICAARYGAGSFLITSRLSQIKYSHLLSKYVLITACVILTGKALVLMFGRGGTAIAFLVVTSAVCSLKRDAAGATLLSATDELFSKIPVIRSIYRSLVRPDTFYSQDLETAFQHAVHNAVIQSIDESISPKGWARRSTSDLNPSGGDFYGS